MKTFTLYWLDGVIDTVKGVDIADAVRRAGYGGGALAALDFYEEGCSNDFFYQDNRWQSHTINALINKQQSGPG